MWFKEIREGGMIWGGETGEGKKGGGWCSTHTEEE